MKKLLCVLMFGMVFGQAELTTRTYELELNNSSNEIYYFDLADITGYDLSNGFIQVFSVKDFDGPKTTRLLALKNLHNPITKKDINSNDYRRLVFDEIFSNLLYLSNVIGLNLDILFVSTCLVSLSVIYIFNFFGKIYLGDGGAYLISFVAGVILIKFSNDNYLVSPYYIVALLWYPAYENLFSIIRKKILKIKLYHLK